MALHPGIPPQKGRVDFGLDSPVSEDSVTALSQKEKKIEILWNNKNSFHTMVLSQQVAELKYSPFKVIPYERGPRTGMCWKENQAWYRHFSLCYLFTPTSQAPFAMKCCFSCTESPVARNHRLQPSLALLTTPFFLIRPQKLLG